MTTSHDNYVIKLGIADSTSDFVHSSVWSAQILRPHKQFSFFFPQRQPVAWFPASEWCDERG